MLIRCGWSVNTIIGKWVPQAPVHPFCQPIRNQGFPIEYGWPAAVPTLELAVQR